MCQLNIDLHFTVGRLAFWSNRQRNAALLPGPMARPQRRFQQLRHRHRIRIDCLQTGQVLVSSNHAE